MNALKIFGLIILSILLFLSLALFGIAFMLDRTMLNPDFVTVQVDKIDISALVREVAEEQIGGQLPEEFIFVKEAVYEVVDKREPYIKEQLNTAINSGYAYLLGKDDNLNISVSLKPLKDDLREKLWRKFTDYLSSDLSSLPEYIIQPLLDNYLREFIDLLPEGYLPPELAGLSEDELKLYLDQYYREFVGQLPEIYLSPELVDLLKVQLEPYFDQYYEEYVGQIPDEFAFDKTSIPPEVMEQIILARQYIGYFRTGYYIMIAFMVLLVAGIILINRNVKGSTRTLGIVFLVYGALQFASVFFARSYFPGNLPLQDVPSSLQSWVVGLYGDFLAPLQFFSLGILVGGVVLLVASFVYRLRLAED